MKLCKDCIHAEPMVSGTFFWRKESYEYADCGRTRKTEINPMTGAVQTVSLSSCDAERNHAGGMCGKLGSHWEQK